MNNPLAVAALAARGATYNGEMGCHVRAIGRESIDAKAWSWCSETEAPSLTVSYGQTDTPEAAAAALGRDIAAYVQEHDVYPRFVVLNEGVLVLGDHFDVCSGFENALQTGDLESLADTAELQSPGPRRRAGRGETLKGKIAAVTGGAQGFGEALVREIVAGGSFCYIIDLNEEGAEALAEALNGEAGTTVAMAVVGNVADEESVEALVERIARITGGLDLFISNAGVVRAASVKEMTTRDFSFVTDVNYIGYFHCVKHVSRALALQNIPSGEYFTDIIQINSKSGLQGSNKNAAYAGGKFGGIGLTQSFAMELVEDSIKVNSICPGNFFDGPLWSDPEKGLFVLYLKAGKIPGAKTIADVKAFYEAKVPMGRGCTGRDVMIAVYYIVEQRYETGQAVPVTGGQVMLK